MISIGRYRARRASTQADLAAALSLRYDCFIAETGAAPRPLGRDEDAFDALYHHLLVEAVATGQIVCCFRLLLIKSGRDIQRSYAAQYYGLDRLSSFSGAMAEVGRFCIHPSVVHDPDVLRLAWAAMTRIVDDHRVEMLFGCSSFAGTQPERYLSAFAFLQDRFLAPPRWRPQVKAPKVLRFGRGAEPRADFKSATRIMPPLLRSYLMMGGWVSDHAVFDYDLNTMHVFTGLEISAMPSARKRLLRHTAARTAPLLTC